MYSDSLIFSQVMGHLPMHTFRRCVDRYRGHHKTKHFSCQDQFRCMAFAQLTYRESLRGIEACLRAQQSKLYHMGIRGGVSRNSLANANKVRDWRICADFAQSLIHIARKLYVEDSFGVELTNTVYALDLLVPQAGVFYIMDRGYLDFARLHGFHLGAAFFVIRAKSNLQCRRLYSRPVDKTTGLRYDQTIDLTGFYSAKDYPDKLRRIKYHDANTGKTFVFLTNNFTLPALTIADLYRCRWQVELFFKWIKQHLRIKNFFGTTANAVKTQIWIAGSVHVLVAIIKKRLNIEASLYTILQLLSITLFEKTHLNKALSIENYAMDQPGSPNQLLLFE